ncbi:MAG: SDR family oxidoreductase [Anaerolineae bacterium]|jgi:NAD(P)-dependent dehydrogenase (short-subunit alcohol dehydrogenase family)|nr:SDR family oxidoreductase [Anaerolineae bacterium]
MARTVLVTGASSGIGRAIALHLTEAGYRVYGTSRHPNPQHNEPFTLLPLDVTQAESVAACVAMIDQIDVLINNAGITMICPVEQASLEDTYRLFETNVFGVLRMIHAVLPQMRARRSGQILNISSLLTAVGMPMLGLYAASKQALEGMTDALYAELAPFNIQISSLQCGAFQTNIQNTMLGPSRPLDGAYQAYHDVFFASAGQVARLGPPEQVAKRVQRILESPRPKLRYRIGMDAHFLYYITRLISRERFLGLVNRRLTNS